MKKFEKLNSAKFKADEISKNQLTSITGGQLYTAWGTGTTTKDVRVGDSKVNGGEAPSDFQPM